MSQPFEPTINLALAADEVPLLRARVGWPRNDHHFPTLYERCQFWAAARDERGQLVAFGYMVGMGLEHGYLEDIMVEPASQRRGLGRALVLALLAEAQRRGTRLVSVSFEPELRGFYAACGLEIGCGGLWRSEIAR